MNTTPPAWHPDPMRRHEFRYWDGTRWTEHVSDRGVVGHDPLPSGDSEVHGGAVVDATIAATSGAGRLFLDDEAVWWKGQRIPYHEITGLHWFVFLMRMTSGATRVLSPVGYPGMPVYRIYLRRGAATTRIEFQGSAALGIYESVIADLEERVCRRLADELLDRVAAGEAVEVAGWDLTLDGVRYGRRSAQWGDRIELEPMTHDAGYTAVVITDAERRKLGKVRHFKEDGPLLPVLFARGHARFAPRSAGPVPAPTPAPSNEVSSEPVDPDWPLELVYSVGNEHSPGSPAGRVVLTLAGSAARLDHHRVDGLHRRWRASIGSDDRHRLRQALVAAGFPTRRAIDHLTADSTIRILALTGGPQPGMVELPVHQTDSMPGYVEAFTWLDTVVLLMTGGEVRDVGDGADPVVLTDIRSVPADPAIPDPSWRTAAARAAAAAATDLGIDVVSPVVVERGDTKIRAMAYFPEFGGSKGIFVFAPSTRPSPADLADLTANGYAYSFLGLPIPYDRARMVRQLDEWTWAVTDRLPPDWYGGPSLDADDWFDRG